MNSLSSASETGAVSPRKERMVYMVLGMVLLSGVVVVSILRDAIVPRPPYQVSVGGTGKVRYAPDIARVTIGVQIDKMVSADAALTELTARVGRITDTMKELGVDTSDIETENYTVFPHYDYSESAAGSRVTGYDANQQLVVTIRNLEDQPDMVGRVVQAATKVGSNQLLGVSFDASNIDEVKNDARIAALKDARTRASAMAGSLGVELGDIVGWWESTVQVPGVPPYYGEGRGGQDLAATAQVPSGKKEVVVEMSVQYEIRR